jgi:hypothetical protein
MRTSLAVLSIGRTAAAGCVVIAIVGAVSCRQLVGIEDREIASCGAPHVEGACGTCAEEQCCAELSACAGDAACEPALRCIAGCKDGDDACRNACTSGQGRTLSKTLASVLSCETSWCAAECHLECGGTLVAPAACAACLGTSGCCEVARTCGASAACVSRRYCREQCTDPSCLALCDVRDTDGASADSALRTCQSGRCPAACTSWTCRGGPRVTANKIDLTLVAVDSVGTNTPVPNLEVRRCRASEAECLQVGDSVQTRPSGVALFGGVAIAERGFDDYFEMVDPTGKFLPERVVVHPAPRTSTVIVAPVLSRLARDQLMVGLGLSPATPERGALLVHTADCQGSEAGGVRVTTLPSDNGATEFYLSRSVPVRASAGVVGTDDRLAFGGFLELEPQNYAVKGTVQIEGAATELLGVAVHVRAGTITFIDYAARR